jgi:hypothetical protein
MICYVSSPVGSQARQRRLYFSCQCGIVAARNEEQRSGDVPVVEKERAG